MAPLSSSLLVLLSSLYIIPSYVLDILLLITLFLSKEKHKFTSNFYKLYGIQCVAAIISSLTLCFVMRLPMAPITVPILLSLPKSGPVPTAIVFFGRSAGMAVYLCEAVISFNRASAILFGARHKQIWSVLMKWISAFIILCPYLFTWTVWWKNVTIDYIDSTFPELGYDWRERNNEQIGWMNNQLNMLIFGVSAASFSLFWNCYTLIMIVKRSWLNIGGNSTINRQMIERLIFSFYLSISLLVMITIRSISKSKGETLTPLNYLLIDAAHFSVSWIFLYTQKEVKASVKKKITQIFKKKKSIATNPNLNFTVGKTNRVGPVEIH